MERAFSYIRTSSEDGKEKLGVPVQRAAIDALADYEVVHEFLDDGITGRIRMCARPQGKLLIAALLADGVKTVLTYDGKRIGRTQPAFWDFIGMARDNGITVISASDRVNLCESVQGGIQGLMSELDRNAIVARLAAGKAQHAKFGKRVNGRYPYGEHPLREYDSEREVVKRLRQMHSESRTLNAIARTLNVEGIVTRYGKQWTATGVRNVLNRTSAQ
jgi:site-specific DNA recombinase